MTPTNAIPESDHLLQVEGLKQYFPIRKGVLHKTVGYVKAVDGVSFHLNAGETIGLVGESGSGKTTVGRCITRLYAPTAGSIKFRTETGFAEIVGLSKKALKPFRRNMQMLFQDPNASLNARMRVGDIVAEPLQIHQVGTRQEQQTRVVQLLEKVGLGADTINRYPHQFSGGQRQRIGIARALSLQPKLIICDEPVSALDVSVQAQVLNLLADLQADLGLTYIFIAHDLSVVEYVSDRIMVMYLGRIVESAKTRNIFRRPLHPYTEALLNAIPKRGAKGHRKRVVLSGDIPSPVNPPTGCVFHPRCKYAEDICKVDVPPLKPFSPDSETSVACHFAEELALQPFEPMSQT